MTQNNSASQPYAILPNGEPNYGTHLSRLENVNLEDFFKTGKGKNPWLIFREKRWFYVGIVHPRVILGCAVIHLGYLGNGFVYAYERQSSRMIEHNAMSIPLGLTRFDRNPDKGTASIRSLNGHITLDSDIDTKQRTVDLSFFYPGSSLSARLTIHDDPEQSQPAQVISPFEGGLFAFTQKMAGLTAEGRITLAGKELNLTRDNTYALLDWTDGFHPRQTFWNWACGAGDAKEGVRIGFNFSSGVYKSGVYENVVWIDGKPMPVGEVEFTYNPDDPQKPWRMVNIDDRVRLFFEPEHIRRADQNYFLVASRFIQPCGIFNGRIQDGQGNTYHLQNISGVVEEHFAKW